MPFRDIEEFAPHSVRHAGVDGRASTSNLPDTTSRHETLPNPLFILLKGDSDGETLIAPYCETYV